MLLTVYLGTHVQIPLNTYKLIFTVTGVRLVSKGESMVSTATSMGHKVVQSLHHATPPFHECFDVVFMLHG